MEDDDNIISSNDNAVTNIPRKKKRSDLFWYDIQILPDLLLIEIIARLPVKSIFRFKSVSKHWKTLISHPSFRRFYFSILDSNTNAAASISFRILYRYIFVRHFKVVLNRLVRPEISESSPLLFLSSFKERERFSHFKVLGMSDGLILCCLLSSTPFDYYVGDPVTGRWINLPENKNSAPPEFHMWEGIITRVNPEDHMLIDFTVVMVKSNHPNQLTVDMYSSESGNWIRYMLSCPNPIRFLRRGGGGSICCYGALHWLVEDHGMDDHGIVAFDPYKEPKSYRLIPLPNDRDLQIERNHDGLYRLCGECQGTLRYFEVAPPDPTNLYFLKMWAMKDYEDGEWCCEFTVSRIDTRCNDPELSNWLFKGTFLPLSFHPLNVNVVYLRCVQLRWVCEYDLLSRRLDFACKLDASFDDLSWRVVMPFVIPRWPMLKSIASQPAV